MSVLLSIPGYHSSPVPRTSGLKGTSSSLRLLPSPVAVESTLAARCKAQFSVRTCSSTAPTIPLQHRSQESAVQHAALPDHHQCTGGYRARAGAQPPPRAAAESPKQQHLDALRPQAAQDTATFKQCTNQISLLPAHWLICAQASNPTSRKWSQLTTSPRSSRRRNSTSRTAVCLVD